VEPGEDGLRSTRLADSRYAGGTFCRLSAYPTTPFLSIHVKVSAKEMVNGRMMRRTGRVVVPKNLRVLGRFTRIF
jgi:hypothetical protein